MLPMFPRTVPVVGVVCRPMPKAFRIGKPEDQRRFATTVSHIVLKIPHGGVHLLLQPIDGILWTQYIHRRFKPGDNKRSIINEFEGVFWPPGLMQEEEFPQASDGLGRTDLIQCFCIP